MTIYSKNEVERRLIMVVGSIGRGIYCFWAVPVLVLVLVAVVSNLMFPYMPAATLVVGTGTGRACRSSPDKEWW